VTDGALILPPSTPNFKPRRAATSPAEVFYGLDYASADSSTTAGDPHRMQLWAGQSAAMAKSTLAGALVRQMWEDATRLL
jgi:hypothetical protein